MLFYVDPEDEGKLGDRKKVTDDVIHEYPTYTRAGRWPLQCVVPALRRFGSCKKRGTSLRVAGRSDR